MVPPQHLTRRRASFQQVQEPSAWGGPSPASARALPWREGMCLWTTSWKPAPCSPWAYTLASRPMSSWNHWSRRRRHRLLLPLGHVGRPPTPVGRGGGLDKAPVCRARGPRDNDSLLGPRGASTSGGGGWGRSPNPGTVRLGEGTAADGGGESPPAAGPRDSDPSSGSARPSLWGPGAQRRASSAS